MAAIGLLACFALAPSPVRAAEHPVGIDVSHHCGEVDWDEVSRHGYTFVYVKATEGVDDLDPKFSEHWEELGRREIPRGAYHFFVTEDDPEEQARFFLATAKPAPGDLRPVVDVEVVGHGTTGDLASKLRRFLEILKAEIGTDPIIYTSRRFWDAHFDDTFSGYPLWVAEYEVSEPTPPSGWSRWWLWQFRENAAVGGVEKGADLSRANGEVGLDRMRIPHPSP